MTDSKSDPGGLSAAPAPAALLRFIEHNKIQRADICRTCGIDPGYLTRMLQGKQIPSIAVAKRVKSATFGAVSVEDWVA